MQIKASRTRHIQGSQYSQNLGWGEEENWAGSLGWDQGIWDLECQGEKNKQEHLEYSSEVELRLASWQSSLWRRKTVRNPINPEKKEFGLVISSMCSSGREIDKLSAVSESSLAPPLSDVLLSLLSFPCPGSAEGAEKRPHPILRKMRKLTHFRETQNCLSPLRLDPRDLKGYLGEDYGWPP